MPNTVEGALMQGLMQGITNGMQNQPPPRQMTPEEIEQQRQAEIARQKAEQERQQKIREYQEAEERAKREREAQLDREAQDSFVLLNSGAKPKSALSDEDLIGQDKKNKDEKKSEGYQKGFDHADQCISRNAGSTCSAGSAEQTVACVADYNAGYNAAAKKIEIVMKEAYDTGEATGGKGELANGPADPRGVGGCRTQWIEAYNRGYFSGKEKHSK